MSSQKLQVCVVSYLLGVHIELKKKPRDSLEITDARKTLARWNLPTPGSVLRIVHTPLFHIVTQKDPAPKGRTVPENVRLQK